MDIKTISVAFVAIMVGAVAFGAMLPIFQDVTATEDTFTNDGYFRMSEITADTDVTIFWDHTKPTVISIDSVEYGLSSIPINKLVSIVGTDKMIIRYVTAGGNNNRIQVYTATGYSQASVSDGTDMTITINSMTVTASNGNTTRTTSVTQGYYVDPKGNWSMKTSDAPAYIHKTDSVMIFAGITNISGGGDVGVFGTGTIDDGMDITYVPTSGATPTVTFGDVTFNYTNVNNYVDLVLLNNCTFDITINDATGNANYSYFIVPYEVTAERAIQGDDGFNTIVNLIPLVIGMGLLLIAVWWFVVRKF